MDSRKVAISILLLAMIGGCAPGKPQELIRGNIVRYARGTPDAECITAYSNGMVVRFQPDLEGECRIPPVMNIHW